MVWNVAVYKRILHFKQPAGTSRGVYRERISWFVVVTDPDNPGRYGVGECAPLPDLSCDALPGYEAVLESVCRELRSSGNVDKERLRNYPSILFGAEMALLRLQRGSFRLFDTPFSRGESGLQINGLIWMGDFQEMLLRIRAKVAEGFRCLKLKIGAIDFMDELRLLEMIRMEFPPEVMELRVDANGAFSPEEAIGKIEQLSRYGVHSIEQPVKAGQWEILKRITTCSSIPVALDEELIGCNEYVRKGEVLDAICPQFIILKPSLHGGISGCEEWIRLAEERHIGWWVTSALESNIGLNAIAQWCASLEVTMPQGLGTGQLFTDNIDFPLQLDGDLLFYRSRLPEPDVLSWLKQG